MKLDGQSPKVPATSHDDASFEVVGTYTVRR